MTPLRTLLLGVREVTGHPVSVTRAPRRPGDIVAQVASSEKARAELGWQPTRPDLRDIVADAWAFRLESSN